MQTNPEPTRIETAVLTAIRNTNLARTSENQIPDSPDAVLFGADSPLDSLGLVSLLMEVEEVLRDEGIEISLSDERAMSQRSSPFRSVPALVRYIHENQGASPA
jgi:acyl carrier protein